MSNGVTRRNTIAIRAGYCWRSARGCCVICRKSTGLMAKVYGMRNYFMHFILGNRL